MGDEARSFASLRMSGLNKRREMERMDQKKRDRRKENLVSLGMDTRARRKARKQQ